MTSRRHPLLAARPIIAAAFAAVLGCSGISQPFDGRVEARATTAGIVASNHTNRTLFYFAAEEGALALTNWALCTETPRCPHIAAGATVTVPWSDVTGYGPEKTNYVFSWYMADGVVQWVRVAR